MGGTEKFLSWVGVAGRVSGQSWGGRGEERGRPRPGSPAPEGALEGGFSKKPAPSVQLEGKCSQSAHHAQLSRDAAPLTKIKART